MISMVVRVSCDLMRQVLLLPFAGRWYVILDDIQRTEVRIDQWLSFRQTLFDTDDRFALIPRLVLAHDVRQVVARNRDDYTQNAEQLEPEIVVLEVVLARVIVLEAVTNAEVRLLVLLAHLGLVVGLFRDVVVSRWVHVPRIAVGAGMGGRVEMLRRLAEHGLLLVEWHLAFLVWMHLVVLVPTGHLAL